MVQKELQTSLTRTKTKKRGFKLPGLKSDKPAVCAVTLPGLSPDTESLEAQIRELASELDSINWELDQMDRSRSATLGSASQRRQTFAVNSLGSSESTGSRDRSRSDLSVAKVGRGYPSEPNLLNVNHHDVSTSRFEPLTPDVLMSERRIDYRDKVQLMSYNKIGSNSDIPMIDDSPSPKRTTKFQHSGNHNNRQSLGNESLPVFSLESPTYSPVEDCERKRLGYAKGMNSSAGLNKSCDLSEMRDREDSLESQTSQRNAPRSKSESTNMKKTQISASALAEIAVSVNF